MKHASLNIFFVLITILVATSDLFLYCYFGKLATDSYGNMVDSLYECKWYGLPIEQQKYFIMMIGNARIPIYYHGFKVAILNLETFRIVSEISDWNDTNTIFHLRLFYCLDAENDFHLLHDV